MSSSVVMSSSSSSSSQNEELNQAIERCMKEFFKRIDSNHNKVISKQECQKFINLVEDYSKNPHDPECILKKACGV
eukprot:UN05062